MNKVEIERVLDAYTYGQARRLAMYAAEVAYHGDGTIITQATLKRDKELLDAECRGYWDLAKRSRAEMVRCMALMGQGTPGHRRVWKNLYKNERESFQVAMDNYTQANKKRRAVVDKINRHG